MPIHTVVPKERFLEGPPPAKSRYQVSHLNDYVVSILIALVVAAVYGGYLFFFRRNYIFNAPPGVDSLYIPNKVIAGVGMLLIAFSFLIGPIYRYFDKFDFLLQYRKEIGIVGGFFALVHPVVSYFFLPLKFPRSSIPLTSIEYGAGLAGVFVVIFLLIITFEKTRDLLGAKRWWFLHRFGLRLVILFTVIHLFYMRWSSWVSWVKHGGGKPSAELLHPSMPGATILSSLFVAWVVIIRLYETIFLYKDLGLKPKEIAQDANLRLRGRRFFIYSFGVLMACYVFVFTRWM
jgi:DMSO/TMAO reductase YedYZ heme-binding membrane subunit